MQLTVEQHTEQHTFMCRTQNGTLIEVDPFVSCAVPHDKADRLVGKTVKMSDYWLHNDCYLCHSFREIQPEELQQ